jgi:hypothetical protein
MDGNRCTISARARDLEGQLVAFLEKVTEKMRDRKTLAVLAVLAMLLFNGAQHKWRQGVVKTAAPEE